jgi:hypothetical protein
MKRTSSYIGTLSTYDESAIADIREQVAFQNAVLKRKGSTNRYRLVVRARLGKNSPYRHLYRVGGKLHRYSSQDIRREHGVRFDMYLHRRYDYRY